MRTGRGLREGAEPAARQCSSGEGTGHREARRGEAARASLFELPLLAAHGAVLLHLLRVQPLEDAVHVEAV